MSPSYTLHNSTDLPALNGEVFANTFMGFASGGSGSDYMNILISKNRIRAMFTSTTSMLLFIRHIFFPGTPFQVFQSIVASVTIKMSAFLLWGTRAAKTFKDQLMHISGSNTPIISFKNDNSTAIFIIPTFRKLFPFLGINPPFIVVTRPNSTIATSIITRIIGNGFIVNHASIMPQ